MQKDWKLRPADPSVVGRLRTGIGCHPAIARILANRGITTIGEAHRFLTPSLQDLRHPSSLKGIDLAAERIGRAVGSREKILIFGDYDVDGLTATAMMSDFLRRIGADVRSVIPHRIVEGYSLHSAQIERFARTRGIGLIITVDCGSASTDAVLSARRAGIDVIITDHHRLDNPLPPALAVVNPHRLDCDAGLGHLSGVGVAFYLLIGLRKMLRDSGFWNGRKEPVLTHYCDLVALGIIADMVPLVAENRILTRIGLDAMKRPRREGVKALMEVSGLTDGSIGAGDVSFRLAPRLNAAGRMAHAAAALRLLTTRKPVVAARIAALLDRLNGKRQEIEKSVLAHVEGKLTADRRLLDGKAVVLGDPDWHEGVLGIVASRCVKRYSRPVVLISTKHGMGKGSARSVPGFDLYRGLTFCADALEGFGGHAMAAGIRIRPENIDRFSTLFRNTVIRETGRAPFPDTLRIDMDLDFADVSDRLLDELESLKPFGVGNPEPIFRTEKIHIVDSRIVGKGHRQMRLRQGSGDRTRTLRGIQFNAESPDPPGNRPGRMAYRLRWNRWNGRKSVQVIVEAT
jgi:single-stranded-DNA-specific exonuclease